MERINKNCSRFLFVLFCFSLFFLLESLSNQAEAQNIGISTTGAIPDPSAGLDINYSNKGLLIPRVSLASLSDAATISSPAATLIIYNTNTAITGGVGIYYNAGTSTSPSWVKLINTSSGGYSSYLSPFDVKLAQYNNLISGSTDNAGMTVQAPNQGAACDPLDVFLSFPDLMNGLGYNDEQISPAAGVNYHIKTDIYLAAHPFNLDNNGCGGNAYSHASLFTGFGGQMKKTIAQTSRGAGFQFNADDSTLWAILITGGVPYPVSTGYTVSQIGSRHTYEVVIWGLDSASFYIDDIWVAGVNQPIETGSYKIRISGFGNQDATPKSTSTLYSYDFWQD